MSLLDELTQITRKRPRNVAFAEAADERILHAAALLASERLANPILIDNRQKICSTADNIGISLNNIKIIDPAEDTESLERYIEISATGVRPLKTGIAKRLLQRPLMYSAMMVRSGDADATIAGASTPTARVIEAGLMMTGPAPDIATPSSYFLMLLPETSARNEQALIYADCAVNVNPSASQLAEIAICTARSAKAIYKREPKVAMLSFSTKGSARHELIDKVSTAKEIVRKSEPNIIIDGEFQFDTAVDERAAKLKLTEPGEVAGQADVLIFPDLNSGNISYKITQYLAGAQAIGPILQGFAYPISDLSRGATVDDIVKSTILLLASTC